MKRIATSRRLLVVMAFSMAIASLAWTLASAPVTSAYAASAWNPSSILNVMKKGTGQVVIAHRGVYGSGCPENSLCAIEQAYNSGIEGVELDVKQSKDGSLWLFHEQRLGRLLDHDPAFDPFQDKNPPSGWDPDVSTLTDSQIANTYLRDKEGSKTAYRALSVDLAFSYIVSHGWNHMVIALDIKSLDAVSRAADLAIKWNLQKSVILKFSSSLLANNSGGYFDLIQDTKGLPFILTMYAPDMANIMKAGWKYSACQGYPSALETSQCTIKSWIMDLQDTEGYVSLEVGNKQPVSSDPTDFLLPESTRDLGAVGGFQPVPEFPDRTGPGRSYVRSNGTCCAALSDYLTPANKWFPAEQQDGREDIHNFWDHGFSSVITDDPQGAIKAATKRNTDLYR